MDMINRNSMGIVFVIDGEDRLSGVLTDGDIRRALLRDIVLSDEIIQAMNKDFVAVHQGTPVEDVLKTMSYRIKFIPVVDGHGRLVDYYSFGVETKIPVAKPFLNGNELKYVSECIATNWISSQGKFVNKFEDHFAKIIGAKYALSTSNGTTALHLALASLGIGAGDEVIVPTLTFIATANAVFYTGAHVTFVDSELDTWDISPLEIEKAVTNKTKAIIPVHLYGQPCKMNEIMEIAKKHSLYVIEDAAEAHGAKYKNRIVGTIGDIGCFSFYGNKIITTGEGGMLVTDNEKIYEKARILRDHGMSPEKKYWHTCIGFNYRLTNLQAAVGCAQLEQFDRILEFKKKAAKFYYKNLFGEDRITVPPENNWSESVYWMFSIVLNEGKIGSGKRDKIIKILSEHNIECRPFFYPIHKMPPYKNIKTFHNAEYLSKNGISLPSYVGINENEIKNICDEVKLVLNLV